MPRCPRCQSRKGKRLCPALETEICSRCCAEERLKTISCPRDCPHLQSELYQLGRRRERACSQGREFLDLQEKHFDSKESREFVFKLSADIYFFLHEKGAVDDAAIAQSLDALRELSARILLPPGAVSPLTRFLGERMSHPSRYAAYTPAHRDRWTSTLARYVRSLGGASTHRFEEVISSFFNCLDFEADLDYSPNDAPLPLPEKQLAGFHQAAGGLILPASLENPRPAGGAHAP